MADTASIRIVKQFTYRGGLKNFSNRYHFTEGAPDGSSAWTTLADAVVFSEKQIYLVPGSDINDITIVEAVGYEPGSDIPVFTKTYSAAGTGAFSSFGVTPGDCAAVLRLSTTQRTSKNHPIYLFNYFHGALWQIGENPDVLHNGQQAAILAYGESWIDGFSDGDVEHKRAGPRGAVAQQAIVLDQVRHRDFPN